MDDASLVPLGARGLPKSAEEPRGPTSCTMLAASHIIWFGRLDILKDSISNSISFVRVTMHEKPRPNERSWRSNHHVTRFQCNRFLGVAPDNCSPAMGRVARSAPTPAITLAAANRIWSVLDPRWLEAIVVSLPATTAITDGLQPSISHQSWLSFRPSSIARKLSLIAEKPSMMAWKPASMAGELPVMAWKSSMMA